MLLNIYPETVEDLLRADLPTVERVDQGANVCIRGLQGSGKGVIQFLLTDRLVSQFGYDWNEVSANFHLWAEKPVFRDHGSGKIKHGTPTPLDDILHEGVPIPGAVYLKDDDFRKRIRKVYRKSHGEIRHKIFLLDESDQVYTHLESAVDKEAQEDLLTLWQDRKLENYFIWTKHLGRGCNKLLRMATEVSIRPYFDRWNDTLYGLVIDGFTMTDRLLVFEHASRAFPHYDRWEYIE